MGSIDYKKLYRLQDRVLDLVFATEREFYLTGGTALSRFYVEKRYSDDLDFFTNSSDRFSFAVKNIILTLSKEFDITKEIDSRDFIRILVDDYLQIDFVNDRVPRYKEPNILENGYIIDSIENILSNKITAIISRDNPKDIFDFYLITKYFDFDWNDILASAKKKQNFSIDDFIIRLKSFPFSLLKNINLNDYSFLDDFEIEFNKLIDVFKQFD